MQDTYAWSGLVPMGESRASAGPYACNRDACDMHISECTSWLDAYDVMMSS